MSARELPTDDATAAAFASSWNHVGLVYSRDQFLDWFHPLDPASFAGRTVLELGFGNGSLLHHMAECRPARLAGVELGDTLAQARALVTNVPPGGLDLHRGDLTTADVGRFDLVYCIGVLHHLQDPELGFHAVLRHVRPGGAFHCWVYAREGNAPIRWVVEPIRRLASRLPWWLTKYALALPLVLPYFVYAKLLGVLATARPAGPLVSRAPLRDYSAWISRRPFWFFHHVAFDQLVTPHTVYVPRTTIERWLRHPAVDPDTTYVIFRNGNSWKFGGRTRDP
jgi:SAM-dependent methyltransferase